MEGSLRLDGTDVVDELVKEYLLFRGFTQTLKVFETEKKNDRSLNFNVPTSHALSLFITFVVIVVLTISFS
jgi:hypothetical protein